MAEIENVATGVTGSDGPISLTTDTADLFTDHLRPGQKDCRVQISLDRTDASLSGDARITGLMGSGQRCGNALSSDIERCLPVNADHVRPHCGHLPEQLSGVHPEVDYRDIVRAHGLDNLLRIGGDELAVVAQTEEPCPGIEELNRIGPGLDLNLEKADHCRGELVHQRVPQLRLRVHHRLRHPMVLRRPSLDQVRRQSERRTGEPDEHLVVPQLVKDPADPLDNRLELRGIDDRQGFDRVRRTHRRFQYRSASRDDVDTHPCGLQRYDDVREEDRRIGVMATHRLQGDLGEQVRTETGVEHADVLTDLAVLGQGTPGLTHHPHRAAGGSLPPDGRQQWSVWRGTTSGPGRANRLFSRTEIGDADRGRILVNHVSRLCQFHGEVEHRRRACATSRFPPVMLTPVSVDSETTGNPGQAATADATEAVPGPFREAVTSMHAAPVRSGITVTDIRPPRKLAPYSHAIGLEVERLPGRTDAVGTAGRDGGEAAVPTDSDGDAFGRLILLHDPRGSEGPGMMKLVAYIQADLDSAVAEDPLLPEVAWDWLTEGLDGNSFSDLGGTVTATASSRFGDIGGPANAFQIEMRASWSAAGTDLSGHVTAFSKVLANVAGLPPEGVTSISGR